jgi:hypothetical protein
MKKRKSIWRLWAKALGQKTGKDDYEADVVAIVRTTIFASYLITNCFIISGVVRHWNEKEDSKKVNTETITIPSSRCS